MIPLRLQLRNFMCYGDASTALVLDGIHIACLSGDNGHGKSALLDALTWAIWGRTRAKTDDDLVHMGKTEMEVEVEFVVAENRYRIIRKRTLRGRRGVSALEFQLFGPDGYIPITGNSIQDTQRKIVAVLRMEYDTFVNSALLLQGRADEFTLKAPAERKKVLCEVLGLSLYDALEQRAKEFARAHDLTRRELTVALADIDRDLDHLPDHQAMHQRVLIDLSKKAAEVSEQEVVLRAAREAKQELDAKSRRLDELRQRCEREHRQIVLLEQQMKSDGAALSAHEVIVADGDVIRSGYARLLVTRERNEGLAQKASQLLDLHQRRSALQQAIAAARASLESETRACEDAIASSNKKAALRAETERGLIAVQHQLGLLVEVETQRNEIREAVQVKRTEVELLKHKNDRLKEEMEALKQKVDILSGEGGLCPVCGTSLGESGRALLSKEYAVEGKRLADEYRGNAASVRELESQNALALQDLADLERRLQERERLQTLIGTHERSLQAVDEASREGILATERLAVLQERLSSCDFARSEQQELAIQSDQIAALGYDPVEHQAVRGELAKLAHYESKLSQLEAAEKAVALLREKIGQAGELLDRSRLGLAELDDLTTILAKDVAQRSRVLADLAEAEDRRDELERNVAELRTQLGRAEQLLAHCAFLAKERKEKETALREVVDQRSIYEELALAFGKKGIQAMIIDSAIPEIEEEANLLLARLTDNRMHVKLETQREAKSCDGVIETLDIKIADELGYRQYEMYSGGEAFRVNFAIRIALSKLLARRAGARLQTLIVDEGFGTQDASGRERLVEAINSISEDFERILVITHISELKDAFPVRIDVVKGAEGSQILLMG